MGQNRDCRLLKHDRNLKTSFTQDNSGMSADIKSNDASSITPLKFAGRQEGTYHLSPARELPLSHGGGESYDLEGRTLECHKIKAYFSKAA